MIDCEYKKKNKIRFSKYVFVIFIPTKDEYTSIKDTIWWDNDLLELFKESADYDIKRLLNIHSAMTVQQAMWLLYQPPSVTMKYNKINFE